MSSMNTASPTDPVRRRFPGEALVEAGLADLTADRRTASALAVAAAVTRVREAGVAVPESEMDTSGRELYRLLESQLGSGAHGRYNALMREVLSYCQARVQDARRRGQAAG